MSLNIDDLQEVLEALDSASSKWFNIGLALGLKNAFLTGLESQYRDNETCLRKMLAEVLNTRHVTWSDLSDALRSPTVKFIPLAEAIANRNREDSVQPVHKTEEKLRDNDVVLSMDHFETILKEVDEARSKWYFIGRGIDCTYADLEEINKYSSNGDRRCLLEMLKVRIQRGGLTSSMLCKSLRGGFVGRDDVAQKIEAINF